jgi:hypothetical protein
MMITKIQITHLGMANVSLLLNFLLCKKRYLERIDENFPFFRSRKPTELSP